METNLHIHMYMYIQPRDDFMSSTKKAEIVKIESKNAVKKRIAVVKSRSETAEF